MLRNYLIVLLLLFSAIGVEGKDKGCDTLQIFGNKWMVYEISGRFLDVSDDGMPYIIFSKDGNVGGFSGCNRFFGECGIDGQELSLPPMAMTKMMCLDGANQIEQNFVNAMSQVNRYDINGCIMTLYNDTMPLMKMKVISY